MIRVHEIEQNSLAERSGFAVGDLIRAINGHDVRDLIDFQVHSSDGDLFFEVERGRQIYEVELSRSPGESFGLGFEEMKLRSCNNKCVFCFIHQMPKGLRRSLYFEDDDYRLSFLHGSYVTLTNVKERDIDRIIDQRLSPQYISVHATDPNLRQTMLGRDLPVEILDRIGKLAEGDIEMHAQVVVCPGWNDGPALERTVRDLGRFYPSVRSVALVPVGLTRFRENLPTLNPVIPEKAAEYVDLAEAWGIEYKSTFGERVVYAADELFLLLDRHPPEAKYYDAFPQLENGIGMVRSFLDTWQQGKSTLPTTVDQKLRLGLVTGTLAARFMEPIVNELNRIDGLSVDLIPVRNEFFGAGITVSGLLAGVDLLKAISGGRWDLVCLPPNCINGEGLTIDDMTVPDLQLRAGSPVTVGDYDLAATLRLLIGSKDLSNFGAGRQLSELGYTVGGRGNREE